MKFRNKLKNLQCPQWTNLKRRNINGEEDMKETFNIVSYTGSANKNYSEIPSYPS
jgi:hypothetical protein